MLRELLKDLVVLQKTFVQTRFLECSKQPSTF